MFTAPPPRPPGVRPVDEPVRESPPADPPAGTVRVYEHQDGRTQATVVGSELDRQLARDRAWEIAPSDSGAAAA